MATTPSHSPGSAHHSPVPDHDAARLMYYLNCVTVSLGLDVLPDDLVDYQNYHWYSGARMALLFNSAFDFSPDIFIDKVLFRDDEGEVVPPGPRNKFVNTKAARDVVSIQRKFILAGRIMDVNKVMFFRSSWLKTFYHGPIKRIAKIISSPIHSECSKGESIKPSSQPASSTVPSRAKGIIYSDSGGRFVATFMIDEIHYIFSGAYNPNPGTYRVNRATLEYVSKGELTGTRSLTGTVGISKVKLKIGNGPVVFGDLPIDNYVEPASTIGGSGTWTTA